MCSCLNRAGCIDSSGMTVLLSLADFSLFQTEIGDKKCNLEEFLTLICLKTIVLHQKKLFTGIFDTYLLDENPLFSPNVFFLQFRGVSDAYLVKNPSAPRPHRPDITVMVDWALKAIINQSNPRPPPICLFSFRTQLACLIHVHAKQMKNLTPQGEPWRLSGGTKISSSVFVFFFYFWWVVFLHLYIIILW